MTTFTSDRIELKTGNVDGGAWVKFYVGEYELDKIMQLALIRDKVIKVTVDDTESDIV